MLQDVHPRPIVAQGAIEAACGSVAPLFPLRGFVAVNPLQGFTGLPFAAACAALQDCTGARLLPDGAEFQRLPAALRDDALLRLGVPPGTSVPPAPPAAAALSFAATAESCLPGTLRLMRAMLGGFLASWFDAGQAAFGPPSGARLYTAWRAALPHDVSAEAAGFSGFRRHAAALPSRPETAIAQALAALEVPAALHDALMRRALGELGGWAGFAAARRWRAAQRDASDDTLLDLLAMRLSWDAALFATARAAPARGLWRQRLAAWRPALPDGAGEAALFWREFEAQRALLAALAAPAEAAARRAAPEARVQAIFCMDVRSERFRHALEHAMPALHSFGAAGFFGLPVALTAKAPEAPPRGGAGAPDDTPPEHRCPVLLAPSLPAHLPARPRGFAARCAEAWTRIRTGTLSALVFVEAAGLIYTGRLARGRAGGRPAPADTACLDGVAADEAAALLEAFLRAIGLTRDFAPLLLLVGHGSATVNNPEEAGLQCGACGGHAGDANAALAAHLLNDPAVRAALARRGIEIPGATKAVAALHDTGADTLHWLGALPEDATLLQLLRDVEAAAGLAGKAVRAARAPLLGTTPARLPARGVDWAETRPEWGLAGNAALIIGPRALTRGRDLAGRCFLHDYDAAADPDGALLAGIFAGPATVALSINLQYFASAMDPARCGSGDKLLHNVTGRLLALQGNDPVPGSGLARQSLFRGHDAAHAALRLSLLVAASPAQIDAALARVPEMARLVRGRWCHVFALDPAGPVSRRVCETWLQELP